MEIPLPVQKNQNTVSAVVVDQHITVPSPTGKNKPSNQSDVVVKEVEKEIITTQKPDESLKILDHTKVAKHKLPEWVRFGFPPPEFLRLNFVGVNLSDHSIKVCKTRIDHDVYNIDFIDSISLAEGAVVDGKIIDPTAVISVLKRIKETYGVEFVRLSVPEELIYLDRITIPPTDPDKLRSVVEFHLGDHVPISVDEAQFDFDINRRTKNGKITEVIATAIPKTTVAELLSVLEKSGLQPLSLEVEAQAIARVSIPKADLQNTFLLLDLGRSRTGISIITNGMIQYTTTISFGGDKILDYFVKNRGITVIEAEKLKQTAGVNPEGYSEAEQLEINKILNKIVGEINRRQDFWYGETGNNIAQVLLVGGNASTPGLASYIQRKTDLPVTVPNVWQNVLAPDDIDGMPVTANESLGYAAVIGLAINESR